MRFVKLLVDEGGTNSSGIIYKASTPYLLPSKAENSSPRFHGIKYSTTMSSPNGTGGYLRRSISSVSGNTAKRLPSTSPDYSLLALQRAEPPRSHHLVQWQSQDRPCAASSPSCKYASRPMFQLSPPRNCGNDHWSSNSRRPDSQSVLVDVLFLIHRHLSDINSGTRTGFLASIIDTALTHVGPTTLRSAAAVLPHLIFSKPQ